MKRRLLVWFVVVCAAAAVLWLLFRPPAKPLPLARAEGGPAMVHQYAGAWWWVEKPDGPLARLVRVDGAGRHEVARAQQIAGYHAGDKAAAWTARDGQQWTVRAGGPDGQGAHVVWTGAETAGPPRIVGDAVYWTVALPAADPKIGPFAPLGASLELMRAPVSGGPSSVVCTLLETGPATIAAADSASLLVVAVRKDTPAQSVIYRVPLQGGPAVRVAADVGAVEPVLVDGALWWAAPSRDSGTDPSVACIRRLTPDGRVTTVQDWLPGPGRLYDTRRGLCFIGMSFDSGVWPVAGERIFPRRTDMPAGYMALAAGTDELLLARRFHDLEAGPLFRMGW